MALNSVCDIGWSECVMEKTIQIFLAGETCHFLSEQILFIQSKNVKVINLDYSRGEANPPHPNNMVEAAACEGVVFYVE